MYVDETGTLDFDDANGSPYFALGTATFEGSHAEVLWDGFQLRCELAARGVRLPKGLHAKNDGRKTRDHVFDLIERQAPRFDTTWLAKANAYSTVRARGRVYLYKLAFFLHVKEIIRQVSQAGDRVYLIAGTLQTSKKRDAISHAIDDVCQQVAGGRQVIPCIWDAPSSWGIQVADYGLWAAQRVVTGRECPWFEHAIRPTLQSQYFPWGLAR